MPEHVPVCELCEALAKPDGGANADAKPAGDASIDHVNLERGIKSLEDLEDLEE